MINPKVTNPKILLARAGGSGSLARSPKIKANIHETNAKIMSVLINFFGGSDTLKTKNHQYKNLLTEIS